MRKPYKAENNTCLPGVSPTLFSADILARTINDNCLHQYALLTEREQKTGNETCTSTQFITVQQLFQLKLP